MILQEILIECFLNSGDVDGGAKYAVELAGDNDNPINIDTRLEMLRKFEGKGRSDVGMYI